MKSTALLSCSKQVTQWSLAACGPFFSWNWDSGRNLLPEIIGKCLLLQAGVERRWNPWKNGEEKEGQVQMRQRRNLGRRDKCEEEFQSLCCGTCDRSPLLSLQGSFHKFYFMQGHLWVNGFIWGCPKRKRRWVTTVSCYRSEWVTHVADWSRCERWPRPPAALSGWFHLAERHCCLVADLVKTSLVSSHRKPNSHCLSRANHCGLRVLWLAGHEFQLPQDSVWPPSWTT